MGKFVPDPEMERLVHEMNQMMEEREADAEPSDGRQGPSLDDVSLRTVTTGEALADLLVTMEELEATDLILVPGSVPIVRVKGALHRLDADIQDDHSVRGLFSSHLGERSRREIEETGAADLSLNLAPRVGGAGLRLRVNLQRQGAGLAANVRALPRRIPGLAELNLPESLTGLVEGGNGLVLVCGPTGSGKSTTIAALLDHLNRTQFRHVITIEEPVEYLHQSRSSAFEQVEIGSDSPTFAAALRSALRRDPDVILVGEMRDLETIATAITAAETGHLILSTLHTSDAAQAVHRVVDVFPATQQHQVSQQLSLSLRAIVCQQLIPRADGGGRVPAVEILNATYAVRNLIRKSQLDRLYNEMVAGRGRGMVSMEKSLADLVRAGTVSPDEARMRSSRPDEFDRLLVS